MYWHRYVCVCVCERDEQINEERARASERSIWGYVSVDSGGGGVMVYYVVILSYLFRGVTAGIRNWCITDNRLICFRANAEATASRQSCLNCNAATTTAAAAASTTANGRCLRCLLAVYTISIRRITTI